MPVGFAVFYHMGMPNQTIEPPTEFPMPVGFAVFYHPMSDQMAKVVDRKVSNACRLCGVLPRSRVGGTHQNT